MWFCMINLKRKDVIVMSVHLHVRSACSLLDSTMSVEQIVKRARALGYHSVALTDENCMHGAMDFYHICKKEGIKPIFGLNAVLCGNKTRFPVY
ncbi:MAG: PHP domain-containing protein [Erysipelotrichaceae bacterium]|nr:PHP domain-containing protein [Erysipelotrichaceae bacterium]